MLLNIFYETLFNLKARIVWNPGLGLDPLELLDAEEVGDPVHGHRVHQLISNQLSDRLGRFPI